MKHIGLFSGIGGFELAAKWAGIKNVASVENDKFCCSILRKNFNHKIYEKDICTLDPEELPDANIISGGDPCQPHSIAGLQKGEKDDRYLWPQMFRIIRKKRPSWVINENVSGSITNGVVDRKISHLEAEGYSCQAFVLPASAVGAAHLRYRVWIIAFNSYQNYNHRNYTKITGKILQTWMENEKEVQQLGEPVDLWSLSTHPDAERFQKQYPAPEPKIPPERLSRYFGFGDYTHGGIPREIAESCIVGSLNGLPKGMDYPARCKRIAALGNSIVPQIAFLFFTFIKQLSNHA